MNFYKDKKSFKVLVIILLVIVGSFALNLFLPKLTSDEAREFVRGLGFWGPLVVILYIIISHIIAPVSGAPMMVLGIALFGIYEVTIYSYLAGIISAVIAFYISRRFGRIWVLKLVGQKTMEEIDDFVEYAGTEMLILSRLFGFSVFDVISYAAGLTKVSFRKYFIITLVFSIPARVVFAFVFRNVDFGTMTGIIIWVGTLGFFAVLFSLFVKMYMNKKRKIDACG
ncbi:TVP38/TMEM64 family protein [Candidatus Falkowbacteria bacterium]|nr:TVP38/TMEM64 family protein [Candidatus Falkowbacteria bacterium]